MQVAARMDHAEIQRRLGYCDTAGMDVVGQTVAGPPEATSPSNSNINDDERPPQTTTTRTTTKRAPQPKPSNDHPNSILPSQEQLPHRVSTDVVNGMPQDPSFRKKKATTSYGKLIRPSVSKRQLMRQISGLGMEDPVFGRQLAGTAASLHHPSQFFDDMSIHDLPEDMRDMVSIASDPTARDGETGFNYQQFHQSLGANFHASMSEFSIGVEEMLATQAEEGEEGRAVSPSSGGEATPVTTNRRQTPSPANNNNNNNNSNHNQPNSNSNTSNQNKQLRLPKQGKRRDDFHASLGTLQSLEMEDVFAAGKQQAQQQQQLQAPGNKTTTSPHQSASRLHGSATRSSSRQQQQHAISAHNHSNHNNNASAEKLQDSNNLVLEAALAMQKEDNGSNHDLIVAALSQSFSDFSAGSADLNNNNNHKYVSTTTRTHHRHTDRRQPPVASSDFVRSTPPIPEPEDAPIPPAAVATARGGSPTETTAAGRSSANNNNNNNNSSSTHNPPPSLCITTSTRQRAMPNLSNVFPQDQPSVRSKKRGGKRHGNNIGSASGRR